VAGSPEPVTLVTMGPLTDIAHRVTADPGWAARIDRLVTRGGSVNMPGNAEPGAEANIAHDPAAAAAVVHAEWLRPPLMVGLDVTHVGTFTDEEFALVAERRTPAARYLAEPWTPTGASVTPSASRGSARSPTCWPTWPRCCPGS